MNTSQLNRIILDYQTSMIEHLSICTKVFTRNELDYIQIKAPYNGIDGQPITFYMRIQDQSYIMESFNMQINSAVERYALLFNLKIIHAKDFDLETVFLQKSIMKSDLFDSMNEFITALILISYGD